MFGRSDRPIRKIAAIRTDIEIRATNIDRMSAPARAAYATARAYFKAKIRAQRKAKLGGKPD